MGIARMECGEGMVYLQSVLAPGLKEPIQLEHFTLLRNAGLAVI